jgi:hypothetical protein
MKRILLATLVMASLSAYAGTDLTTHTQQEQSTVSNSGAGASAMNAGNSQQIIFNSGGTISDEEIARINGETARAVADSKIRNTPSMSGPPLVSSNDTCMGSASGAVTAPGFGVSVGKTYTDTNCVMLKNSRELWNMGMKAAALARMCMNEENRDSLEMTGFVCAQTERANRKQAAVPVSDAVPTSYGQHKYTDPIVRARLGLPALDSSK